MPRPLLAAAGFRWLGLAEQLGLWPRPRRYFPFACLFHASSRLCCRVSAGAVAWRNEAISSGPYYRVSATCSVYKPFIDGSRLRRGSFGPASCPGPSPPAGAHPDRLCRPIVDRPAGLTPTVPPAVQNPPETCMLQTLMVRCGVLIQDRKTGILPNCGAWIDGYCSGRTMQPRDSASCGFCPPAHDIETSHGKAPSIAPQ